MNNQRHASPARPLSGVPTPSETQFKKALLYSAGFHLLLFIVFAVRAVIYPSDAISLDDAVRVDIVALPDKKSAEIPNLPPPVAPAPTKTEPKEQPAPKPEPVKPETPKAPPPKPEAPTVDLNKTKRDQAAALKRLEALERIERMERQQKASQSQPAKPSRSNEPGESAPSQVVKGNQKSEGNALRGLQRLEHRGYLANVQSQVKRYWTLPPWMVNQKYSARVRIWVDSGGTIIKKQMIRASGNSDFDDRVMAAIEAAGKLPEPPTDLVNVLSVDGLDADFP